MLVTDSFPPVKEVTFPAQQREFTLVKRTPFIGTPLWIVFERDGEAEPQQVARFTDFYLACDCFDSLVEDAKNEDQQTDLNGACAAKYPNQDGPTAGRRSRRKKRKDPQLERDF